MKPRIIVLCAEAWRLWRIYDALADEGKPEKDTAWAEYRKHRDTCPNCTPYMVSHQEAATTMAGGKEA